MRFIHKLGLELYAKPEFFLRNCYYTKLANVGRVFNTERYISFRRQSIAYHENQTPIMGNVKQLAF